MKHYFIADGDIQTGPFTYEDILSKKITKSTLMWTEGFDDWKEANQIEELKNVLISEPPPIPKKANINSKNENEEKIPIIIVNDEYDNTYEKETNFSIIGIAIIIFTLIANYQINLNEHDSSILIILILISFVIRIAVAINIQKIALRQNRDSSPWAVFGFLLPALALIIIGQLQKLKLDIYNNLKNPKILFRNAKTLYDVKKYTESLLILDKIIENDKQNCDYLKLRTQIQFDNKNYESANKDLEQLVKNNQHLDFAYNILGEIAIVNKNKEMAISYWNKALYSAEAIKNLNIYKNFENQYVLNRNQVQQKTQKDITFQATYFLDGKYVGGLSEIDDTENTNFLSTNITLYDMGISIELSKTIKTYFIAISYFEVNSIIYNNINKIFTLFLNDKKELAFKYDIEKDSNLGIQKLEVRFYDLLGKNINYTN